jgi:FkbM family methyltransferase
MRSLRKALRRRFDFLRQMPPHIGIAGTLRLRLADEWDHLARRIRPGWCIRQVHVWLRDYDTSIAIRLGSSDLEVFRQIFVQQQYMPITKIKDPEVVVDCGANAGYSALFFLKHFPCARVIALEPDPHNVELCRHNVRRFRGRIEILQKAIWGTVAKLGFVEETRTPGEEWGIQVEAMPSNAEGEMVEAIDIPNLLAVTGLKYIDLLKVDIEKSEADVFRTNPGAWLPLVRNIAIELHGPTCAKIFHSALSNYSFLEEQCGEVTLCLGMRPKAKAFAAPG